jgi:hypothetical protein
MHKQARATHLENDILPIVNLDFTLARLFRAVFLIGGILCQGEAEKGTAWERRGLLS